MSGRTIEAVIGLEIHVQLATRSKMFCGCAVQTGETANRFTCPVCLGLPGALPVPNREAVRAAVRFGAAVGATVHPVSRFARKNYFYPDLPKGYQISQYEEPIVTGGALDVEVDGAPLRVPFVRAHLEEDAGKSFHPEAGREAATWVDLNRAGTPLLEVVTEPVLSTPEQAHVFLARLRQTVRYLGISEANMEEGNLRCDANVSVRYAGQTGLNAKTEVKNLNSFRHVERAIAWEIQRQSRDLEEGTPAVQATRLWNESENRTRVMRTKEDADDYRYFPDPDLPALTLAPAWIAEIAGELPELPAAKEARLVAEFGLKPADAQVLASEPALAGYFEEVAAEAGNGAAAAHWVLNDLLYAVKQRGTTLEEPPVDARALGALVRLIEAGTISGKIAKTVFEVLLEEGGDPGAIVESRGLKPIDDTGALDQLVEQALDANPGPVADYLGGKEAALQFLMGQVMRLSQGKARPADARDRVKAALEARRS